MSEDMKNAVDWLNEIITNPEGWQMFYSESETKICAEAVLALLKEQETEDTGRCRVFQCKKCGFGINDIFVNDEEKYQNFPKYCPNCGRLVQ